ncbi:MAG: BppU family phage baseplate upper protein [Cetobacterium sp.]
MSISISNKKIVFDIEKELIGIIEAKQKDLKTRYLTFTLLSNGQLLDLTNKTVKIFATKQDNTSIYNDGEIVDVAKSIVKFELTSQFLAVYGMVTCEIGIFDRTTGAKLTSYPFSLKVIKCVNDENSLVSTNEYGVLSNLILDVEEAKKQIGIIGSLKTETDRLIKEGTKVNTNLGNTIEEGKRLTVSHIADINKAKVDAIDLINKDTQGIIKGMNDRIDGQDVKIANSEKIVKDVEGRFNEIVTSGDVSSLADEVIRARQGKTKLVDNIEEIKRTVSTNFTTTDKKISDTKTELTNTMDSRDYYTMRFRTSLSNQDLNTLIEFGIYTQNANVQATTQLHYPTNKAGLLEVFGYQGHIYQRYTTYAEDRTIYIRGSYNNTWSTWSNQDNATTLQGYSLFGTAHRYGSIPTVGSDGGLEIGKYIDFHIVNGDTSDNAGRITANSDGFHLNMSLQTSEITGTYFHLKTYPNYGAIDMANIWFDNREGVKKLVVDNTKNVTFSGSNVFGRDFFSDQGFTMYNGSLVDGGDSRKPYLGTRRSAKAWAFADSQTHPEFWGVFASKFELNSDERIKNISPVEEDRQVKDLEIIKKITPKVFNYITDDEKDKHYGFIAQEVENEIPTAVTILQYEENEACPKGKNGEDIRELRNVNVMDFVATLWSANKELIRQVEDLTKRLEKLEG